MNGHTKNFGKTANSLARNPLRIIALFITLAFILTSLGAWGGLPQPAGAAEPQVIIRQAPETEGDLRYQYYWDLLDHALAATVKDFRSL